MGYEQATTNEAHFTGGETGNIQRAVAAALIAVDRIRTATYDSPPVPANLDSFFGNIPDRGMGSCGDRPPARVPRFANAGVGNGVVFCQGFHVARRGGWFLYECESDAELDQVVLGAANLESSLHLVAYRIGALGVRLGNTRRTTRAGFRPSVFSPF